MSWLKTAVNKAVEASVGERGNITRAVRTYADSVVHHAGNAVSEGAKLLQDRIGPRNMQSFRHTVKRLEEVSVSCRGVERIRLLRRWLVALKESERFSLVSSESIGKSPEDLPNSDELKVSKENPSMVYYVDTVMGSEPRTFRDVFLCSQALEGITLSMILEAPTEEENSLLLEIYGLCLTGGKDVHNTVLKSVQNLASSFVEYEDEVLVKREELLQYAQSAISGLKINADLARLDAESCSLKETLTKKGLQQISIDEHDNSFSKTTTSTIEGLEEALKQIQMCSKLEELLLKKMSLRSGESPVSHAEKVDKLKILSESLTNSLSKAEKRVADHREQNEEAISFRVSKGNEMSQVEKDLGKEIGELERQKDELEAELKKVNGLLTAANVRIHNAKEEREHFEEASNQILAHLKTKEDELFRSITSCRVEAGVVDAWINFLDHTWTLYTSNTEQRKKHVSDELDRCREYFVNLVIHLLSSYKEKLVPFVLHIRKLEENLSTLSVSETSPSLNDASSKASVERKKLEDEYLNIEAEFVSTLSVVDTLKKQFLDANRETRRNCEHRVQDLFDELENIKEEFQAIKRSKSETTRPTDKLDSRQSSKSSSPTSMQTIEIFQTKSKGHDSSPPKEDKRVRMVDTSSPMPKQIIETFQMESKEGNDSSLPKEEKRLNMIDTLSPTSKPTIETFQAESKEGNGSSPSKKESKQTIETYQTESKEGNGSSMPKEEKRLDIVERLSPTTMPKEEKRLDIVESSSPTSKHTMDTTQTKLQKGNGPSPSKEEKRLDMEPELVRQEPETSKLERHYSVGELNVVEIDELSKGTIIQHQPAK